MNEKQRSFYIWKFLSAKNCQTGLYVRVILGRILGGCDRFVWNSQRSCLALPFDRPWTKKFKPATNISDFGRQRLLVVTLSVCSAPVISAFILHTLNRPAPNLQGRRLALPFDHPWRKELQKASLKKSQKRHRLVKIRPFPNASTPTLKNASTASCRTLLISTTTGQPGRICSSASTAILPLQLNELYNHLSWRIRAQAQSWRDFRIIAHNRAYCHIHC